MTALLAVWRDTWSGPSPGRPVRPAAGAGTALAEDQAGTTRPVLVGGEAGVGKSRLVSDFAEQCRSQGVRVLARGDAWNSAGRPAVRPVSRGAP